MSRETLSGKGCQQRYKGIENFLRRVAFNLGNTPSETEVKIISCIPIDVTDLQQKIADLERQLEETTANNASSPDKQCSSNRQTSSDRQPSLDKQPSPERRLTPDRRSFNEKKSPTKKLSSGGAKKASSKPTSVVANQVLCVHSDSKDDCKGINCNRSSVSAHFDYSPELSKKSAISFLYPTSPAHYSNIDAEAHFEDDECTNKWKKLQCKQKSFFSKKKCRSTKKRNCQTKLVYYAAPDTNTPFNNFSLGDDVTSKNAHRQESGDCNDDKVYFTHILNKQYMPRPALNDLSNTSEFSSPVCRDNVTCHATSPYESDVCSCCRGPFQNLDQHMSPAHKFNFCSSFTDKENDNKYAYYDSNAYDVIPVKENDYKNAEDFDVLTRRYFGRHIDMKCWPESVRSKKVQPTTVPRFNRGGRWKQRVIVNCHTVVPNRNNLKKTNKINSKKDIILNKMAASRPILTHSLNLTRNLQNSEMSEVDFGEIYAKHKLFPKPVTHNVSCSTTILNNSECQTGKEANESLVENKTAVTLNQIKVILQSVLTEVKTKGKLSTDPEPKKDAVVQNSFSQSNICGGSHLLNSFTYSHYNTSPYIASCSRQTHPNNYCPPNASYNGGAKCVQQYPLFVQPNHHLCTPCARNNHNAKQPAVVIPSMRPAPAITAATNTDQTRDRSKETQKLIKEIYNSIALNIGIPTKDIALNQGDRNKNSKMYVVKMDSDKDINQRTNLISEIFKNPNPLNTSGTEKMTPVSELTSNDTTCRSVYNNKRTPLTNKYTTINKSVDSTTVTGDTETDRGKMYRVEGDSEDEQSDETAVNEEDATDSSTTDDDTETIHVPVATELSSKKQERKGILSKMFKLFTPRNRRQPKKSSKEEYDSESNSDDYQTVYSQKIARPKTEVREVQEVRKVHRPLPTKVIHSKHQRIKQRSPERLRKSPYMEQEYRRYWDEKLLFQERYAKHSTELSRMTTPLSMARPVYYQNYEARSALVEPNRRITASAMRNINRNPTRKSSYAINRTNGNRARVASKGLTWLKNHKLGVHCGDQWKKLILEG